MDFLVYYSPILLYLAIVLGIVIILAQLYWHFKDKGTHYINRERR